MSRAVTPPVDRGGRITNAHAAIIPDESPRRPDIGAPNHPRDMSAPSSDAVRRGLNSDAVAGALRDRAGLRAPAARAAVSAVAATAAWNQQRGDRDRQQHREGWWRHRDGGYGWVGPLFWPFAYDDVTDYAMFGNGDAGPFWDYGYGDLYAGLFSPYGYDQLSGYLPDGNAGVGSAAGTPPAASAPLRQMCGDDSQDIAGLSIDQIRAALSLDDAQRGLLDALASASAKAAQAVRAACPAHLAATAPGRLADMQQRILAMIAAVAITEPPLQQFYDALSDDQKARLNALGQDQRKTDAAAGQASNQPASETASCGATAAGVTDWPTDAIDARLHPTEVQRASLTALRDASVQAADLLKASCQPSDAITPPARLQAAGKRLDVMLRAVRGVAKALDNFYGQLSDEQKAQFEAIGPARSGAAAGNEAASQTGVAAPAVAHHNHHHRHQASLGGFIRRLVSFAR
jgi:hypothetical protein